MNGNNFNITEYCDRLREALLEAFAGRLCYMGLQGSYLRGEATEDSDIDIMVILQSLTAEDMRSYKAVLDRVGEHERACGFICSAADMAAWNPLEICQLKHTTRDIYGTLADFLPEWSLEDELNYIKLSLNNLYHALCHSYIHGDRCQLEGSLLSFYKAAFFILQNTYYYESRLLEGENAGFVLTKKELAQRLAGEDRQVIQTLLSLSEGGSGDFDRLFELLFHWCQNKAAEIGRINEQTADS